MKLSSIPQSLTETFALAFGIVPTPLIETLVGLLLSKEIIAATATGIFDVLEKEGLSASEVAFRCKTDLVATEKLLRALCGCGYLTWDWNRYRLTRVSRRWLLRGGGQKSTEDRSRLMAQITRYGESGPLAHPVFGDRTRGWQKHLTIYESNRSLAAIENGERR